LYGLAKRHALNYIKKQRRRYQLVKERMDNGKGLKVPEVLSELELASMRAEAQEGFAAK